MNPLPTAPDAEAAYAHLKAQLIPRLAGRDPALIGIHSGGAWLAERLARDLKIADLGFLDISFYRDDFQRIGLHPQVKPTAIPFEIEGRAVVLVDDVLFTGRTIRAAMNALFDYGRPERIELAVLVDRVTDGVLPGYNLTRELPVAPSVAGLTLSLPRTANLVLQREGTQLRLAIEEGA